MYPQQVIRNCFNEFFIIIPPWQFDARLAIEPVDFWGLESTRTFLSLLYVPPEYWQDLLSQLGIQAGPDKNEISIAVSQALLNR